MKKLIFIVLLLVLGFMIYMNLQEEPDVRLQNALSKRWFNPLLNTTGFLETVERFEVSETMHVKVFLTGRYDMLPNTQGDCLRSIAVLVRTEEKKNTPASIEFIKNNTTLATVGKSGTSTVMAH